MVIPSVLQPDVLKGQDFPKSAGQENHKGGNPVDIHDHSSPQPPGIDEDYNQRTTTTNPTSSSTTNKATGSVSQTNDHDDQSDSERLQQRIRRPDLTEHREPSDEPMTLASEPQRDGGEYYLNLVKEVAPGSEGAPLGPLTPATEARPDIAGSLGGLGAGVGDTTQGRNLRDDLLLMSETNKVSGDHPEEQQIWVREHYRSRTNTGVSVSMRQQAQQAAMSPSSRKDESLPEQDEEDKDKAEAESTQKRTRRESSGEWVRPLQAFPMERQSSSIEESVKPTEGKIVLPAFYRKPSMDQGPLSHRLAVLSVNNFSGQVGVGEEDIGMDPVEEDRKRARKQLGDKASADQIEKLASEIKKERVDKKEEEIAEVLKHGSVDALKKKIVPLSLLRTAKEGDAPGNEKPSRPSQTRQDTERTLNQIAEANRRDFAQEEIDNKAFQEGRAHDDVQQYNDEEAEAFVAEETERRSRITRQEKLAALHEEFGSYDDLYESGPKEEFIVECKGGLFRGILIIGNIHLTTHRLTFHAILPPPKILLPGDESSTLVHTGAATIRRQNPVFASKTNRVWMELDAEMITTYPSADEEGRVKPLRSILLESVEQLYPLDPSNPFEIKLKYRSPKGEKVLDFTVDTQESALHWHRDLESSLFQQGRVRRYYRRLELRKKQMSGRPDAPTMTGDGVFTEDDGGWEMLRVSLPLDRIRESGTDDYMDFARLISLYVDVMEDDQAGCDHSNARFSRMHPDNPTYQDFENARKEAHPHKSGLGRFFGHFKKSSHSSPDRKSEKHGKHASSSEAEGDTKSKDFGTVTDGRVPPPTHSNDGESNTGNLGNSAAHSEPRTGAGAFRGPSQDPQDLTSNASILPAQAVKFRYEGHSELRAAVNIKFGVLNERAAFADKLHETIQRAHDQDRRYRPGVERPKPVFQVGQSDLLRLPEVEGGAGLPEDVLKGPSAPHHLPKRQKKDVIRREAGPDSSSETSSSSESDESETDSLTSLGDPGGIRRQKKAQNAQVAKAIFGIPETESVWMKRCYLNRTVPFRGHIILSEKYLCFWRKGTGPVPDIKYRFPVHDLKSAEAIDSIRFKVKPMSVQIAGRHDLHFDFFSPQARAKTLTRIKELVANHAMTHTDHSEGEDSPEQRREQKERAAAIANTLGLDDYDDRTELERKTHERMKTIDILGVTPEDSMNISVPDHALAHLPAIVNDYGSRQKVKARRFALLTIGSRGDVQPYIALALGLMKDGHQCVIVTHDEFKVWVEGYGIEHRQAGGDPAALMKLSVDHAMFSPGFFKESLGNFRSWLDDLLKDAWESCQGVDVLIESPSTMAGIHIAEALKIPYMRAFTMPWTRTVKYPQAFMVPAVEMGPGFNYSSYVLFDNIIWKATAPQINPWRKEMLGLPATDMSHLSQTKVPFMYNFSSTIVPKPLDWHDDIAITGYWTLANSDADWSPPDDLEEFMMKAEKDDKPLVYIGFGSITVPDPDTMTRNIIKAVDQADVRAIIAKGWSSKGSDESKNEEKEPMAYSDNCYPVDKVPHGWLFPKIKAALHHGGAGTVGASLTAGLPTLIKPWFGDQFFWAGRVTHLGVGLKVGSLDVDDLADALRTATRDTVMIERAAMLGEKIRQEDGVKAAINYIYANLPRASKDRTQLKWQKN